MCRKCRHNFQVPQRVVQKLSLMTPFLSGCGVNVSSTGIPTALQMLANQICYGISRGQSPLGVGLNKESGLGARDIGKDLDRVTGD